MEFMDNEPALSGQARVEADGAQYKASYQVFYRIDQQYDCYIVLSDLPELLILSLIASDGQISVQLDNRPEATVNLIKSIGSQWICSPNPGFIDDEAHSDEIHTVTAKLVNFKMTRSQKRGDNYSISNDLGSSFLGKTHFVLGDCEIEIRATKYTKSAEKKLKKDGGFAITHEMTIKPFCTGKINRKKLLEDVPKIQETLSFVAGASIAIHELRGYSLDGSKIYEPIMVHKVAPYEGRLGWFDPHCGQLLGEVCPGLFDLLSDSASSKIFGRALYWYIRANSSAAVGIDSAIILSLTALELLSGYSIEEYGLSPTSHGKNGNIPLGNKIRAAAVHHGIPTKLEKELHGEAYKVFETGQWKDVPEAIARFRNDLVHPKEKIITQNRHELTIAIWQASMWYVELFILYFAGHRGLYSNRLTPGWLGQVEEVPWAKKS